MANPKIFWFGQVNDIILLKHETLSKISLWLHNMQLRGLFMKPFFILFTGNMRQMPQ